MRTNKGGKKVRLNVDGTVITAGVLALCVVGSVFVYSASCYTADKLYGDSFFFLKKQIVGYVLGLFVYFAVRLLKFDFLKKVAFWACVGSAVLLLLVLTPLGVEVYGAKRWLKIGSVTVQPSEIAKFCLVLFFAAYFSQDRSRADTFKGSLPFIAVCGVFCLLVIAEPNMSVTVCLAASTVIMLFTAGFPVKKILAIGLPLLLAVPLLIVAEPYRLKRLMAFVDPWASPKGEGYQLIQSLYALGSGGWFGVGLFNSRQKMRFLPFAESDFILSIIGEETGFIGVAVLLLTCVFLAVKIVAVGRKNGSFYAYFLCVGVACVFIVQVFVNALVVTGSIPPTGIPFPLISSGNTQIITFCASFGLVRKVASDNQTKRRLSHAEPLHVF